MQTGVAGTLQRSWWLLLIYGVISVLFGISAFLSPLVTALALAWAFGVMALAEGIISLVAVFSATPPISKGWLVLHALSSILFGIVAILLPGVTASVLLLFLAAWLVVAGIYRIAFAIRVREHIDNEWLIGLSGALAIVLGVLFFVFPITGLISVVFWIGAAMLVYGVFQIMAAMRVRKLPVTA